MEEQLSLFLKNILQTPNTMQSTSILDKYYVLFKEKKYFDKEFVSIYKDMEKTYGIDLQSLQYDYNNSDMQNIYKELIYAVINTSERKQKIKLFPLIVFLDQNNILYEYLYEITFFDNIDNIKDYLVGIISDSYVSINVPNISAYHWEKESYESYKQANKNLEFKKIYNFVDSLERGVGLYPDIFMDFLVFISYRLFFKELCDLMDKKSDTIELIYLTKNLSIKEMLHLANKSKNIIIKFEAVRKSVYFKTNKHFCLNLLADERELLQNILIDLSKDKSIWSQFLDFYLEYPLRAVQLFKPLGEILHQIDNDKALSINNHLRINNYFNEDSKEALNICFLNIENDDLQKKLLMDIFFKWNGFVESYSDYVEGMLLTNVNDLVIVFVRDYLSDDTIEKNIKNLIFEIEEINNKWFSNAENHRAYLFKLYSKLFIYSFCIDEKVHLIELKAQIRILINNDFAIKKERELSGKKTTAKLFYDNIFTS